MRSVLGAVLGIGTVTAWLVDILRMTVDVSLLVLPDISSTEERISWNLILTSSTTTIENVSLNAMI